MRFLRVLLFFPSVTFGLTSAEVFPYAFFYSLVYFRKISYYLLLVSAVIVTSVTFVIFAYSEIAEAVKISAAYLNPLLIFLMILRATNRHVVKLKQTALGVFAFSCALVILQTSGLISSLDPFFKTLVPRAYASSMGHRGITLLATEPSRASVEFIFLYLLCRLTLINRKYWFLTDLLLGVVLMVCFRAATGMMLYAVMLLLFNRKLLITMTGLMLLLVLYGGNLDFGRFYKLILDLAQLPLDDAFMLLMSTSGNRIISIYASTIYGFNNFFGGGIGNWKETSIDALLLTGVDYTKLNYFNAEWKDGSLSFRMSGYFMNLILDIGYVGALIFFLSIYQGVKPFLATNSIAFLVFIFFVFNIMIVGSVGVPVPWICTAIILRVIFMRQEKLGE